jgi:hypothetical protein
VLRSTVPTHPDANPSLHSISIGPASAARAASSKSLYRKRARAACSRHPLRRKRSSDKSLTRSACVKSFFDLVLVSIASPSVPHDTPLALRAGSGVKGRPTVFVGPFIAGSLTLRGRFATIALGRSRASSLTRILLRTSTVTPFVWADDAAAIVEFPSLSNLLRSSRVTSSIRCCPPNISPATVGP